MAVSRLSFLSNLTDKINLINRGLSYLKQYPADELARLLVDARFYDPNGLIKESFMRYESREPGCTVAYFCALSFLVQHLQQKIDIEFIKQLHAICMSGFVTNVYQDFSDGLGATPGKFRGDDDYVAFGIHNTRMTKEGVKELLDWMSVENKEHPEIDSKVCLGGQSAPTTENGRLEQVNRIWNEKRLFEPGFQGGVAYWAFAPAFSREEASKTVDSYNKAISNAITDDEKLTVIVTHIETFERLHPFRDGNGRVFVNLLLNFMLMQNGFPPATFYEPNLFDAYGTANTVQKVKEAMQVTKDIIAGKKDVFGYALNEDEKKYSRESASVLTTELNECILPSPQLMKHCNLFINPESSATQRSP